MTIETEDPRITGDYVRRFSGDGTGDVTLVGVVHDHPASMHRVRSVLDATGPEVLALELPPLAVPLYEQYAADDRSPPPFGGEMSAAVQAATTDRVVGIDGPSVGFAGRLFRRLADDPPSVSVGRSVVGNLASVTRHTLTCRLAAAVAARTGVRLEVDVPETHGCDWADDPQKQAGDERSQIRRARSITKIFGESDTTRICSGVREGHMSRRLSALRREGEVVAVVGIAHLDPLTRRLTDGSA